MPTELECPNCSLNFSIGWFHNHEFSSGYGSQMLLVCIDCGTQHTIEIALSDRGPELIMYCDIVLTSVADENRLSSLSLLRKALNCTPFEAKQHLENLPVQLAQRLLPYQIEEWERISDTEGLTLQYPVVYTEPNPDYGPIQTDRLLGAGQPRYHKAFIELQESRIALPLTAENSINIGLQQCSHCSSIGTLTSEFDASEKCPECNDPGLNILSQWIT